MQGVVLTETIKLGNRQFCEDTAEETSAKRSLSVQQNRIEF